MTEFRAVMTSSAEAEPLPFLGTDHRLLVPAEWTAGALSVLDSGLVPAGFSPPLHSHLNEHELFLVSSGTVRFRSGSTDKVIDGSGAALLPAGTPHSFEVISDARMFVITVPGGEGEIAGDFEGFARALSAATNGVTLDDEELAAAVAHSGAAHDIPIVGPPLRRPPVTRSSQLRAVR